MGTYRVIVRKKGGLGGSSNGVTKRQVCTDHDLRGVDRFDSAQCE